MGMKSKRKGKVGELEFAAKIAEVTGCEARRGQQYSGSNESPDVVTDIPEVHFEVKRVESLRLYPSMDQAIRDAGQKVPVVVHRPNRRDWVAILRVDDLVRFAKIIAEHQNGRDDRDQSQEPQTDDGQA